MHSGCISLLFDAMDSMNGLGRDGSILLSVAHSHRQNLRTVLLMLDRLLLTRLLL